MEPQQLTQKNNQIKVDGHNNIIIQDAQGLTLKVFELEQINELRSLLAGVPELLQQLQAALASKQQQNQLTLFPPLEKTVYGRDRDLQKLEQLLQQQKSAVLVNGLGGIGKTTLAALYFHTYFHRFRHTAWVSMADGAALDDTFIQDQYLIQSLGLGGIFQDWGTLPDFKTRAWTALYQALRHLPGPNLLVIDNLNRQALQDIPLQLAPNWTLLYTSRDQLYNVEALPLDVLDPTDARDLFYAHYHLEKDELLLTQALTAVQYHTLTLELLAKTAQKLHYRLAELLQVMEENGIDISAGESVPINAQHQPKARIENIKAYLLSIFDIAPLSTAQLDILRSFSLFPYDPENSLKVEKLRILLIPDLEDEKALIRLRRDLGDLIERGWLQVWSEGYLLHPVLQEVLRSKLDASEETCAILFERLNLIFRQDQLEMPFAFADIANSVAQKIKTEGRGLAELAFRIGNFYRKIGQFSLSMAYYNKSAEISEQNGDKQNFANVLTNIGKIHQAMGNFDAALRLFEQQKELFEQLFKANPQSEPFKNGLAISYEKLGSIHQAMGNFDAALQFFEQRFQLGEQLFQANPQSGYLKNGLAIAYEKLGDIHQDMGNFEPALQFFEQQKELFEQLFKANPQSESLKNGLAISYSKLGAIHQAMGNFDAALQFFEQRAQLGEQLSQANPQSEPLKNGLATSYGKLGEIHYEMGNIEKAIRFFTQVCGLFEQLFKANPQSESLKNGLAIAYEKLGDTHQAMGNFDAALQFFEQQKELFEQLFKSNPQNYNLANGLAIAYFKLGECHAASNGQLARAYYERCLPIWQELKKLTGIPMFEQYLSILEEKMNSL